MVAKSRCTNWFSTSLELTLDYLINVFSITFIRVGDYLILLIASIVFKEIISQLN